MGLIHNKINLFTYDIILILTDPLTSLPEVQKLLTTYAVLSYYKINYTRSQNLGTNLQQVTKSALSSSFPYLWTPDLNSCVVISLTRPLNYLIPTLNLSSHT